MSAIRATDPLALFAIQSGQQPTPAVQDGADGSSPLDIDQQAHVIGDPVPIVFGRRRNGTGGVFISPKATECRFENDTSNNVTAYYHMVLSEGQIGTLQVRDVFQQQLRVGEAAQTYNRRAGTWTPGNAIVEREGFTKPEASYYCGTIGQYNDISTLSFRNTEPDGSTRWRGQVHCFVREGVKVFRLLDSEEDVASDSFADLAYWLMRRSARIPEELIDTDSLEDASRFLDVNNITTNCWIRESINFSDWISEWGRYHLLRLCTINGKQGLKPLLPVRNNGTINTDPLTVQFTFNDDIVIPGSVDIQYSDRSTRQPFVCQIIWRQDFETTVGIVRTAEIRFNNTAPNGPYEAHDLSAFCTREDHAVKVGAYILSKRIRSTHTIRFKVRPQTAVTNLQQGSIARVYLARDPSTGGAGFHDYVYQVERITKTLAGDIQYECSHLPVDGQFRSLIALDVVNTQPTGFLFPLPITGTPTDENADDDTDPLPDEFAEPQFPPIGDVPVDPFPGGGGGGSGGGGELPAPGENPPDNAPVRIGPMDRCPSPGLSGFDTGEFPPGTVVTRIIGNIGDATTPPVRETGGLELWTIPVTPPSQLGGTNYNGKFIAYEYTLPDGRRFASDPCGAPQSSPLQTFRPRDYTFFQFSTGAGGWFRTDEYEGFFSTFPNISPGSGIWRANGTLNLLTPNAGVGGGLATWFARSTTGGQDIPLGGVRGQLGQGLPGVQFSGNWLFSDNQEVILATWDGQNPPYEP